jgi:protein-L-isoaspartate O-methyltransferase
VGTDTPKINYSDNPIKVGSVHLSAPSIYAALDIRPGNSFLNIGAGAGYLSTIVGMLAGTDSITHGVEHNGELVELVKIKSIP